MNKSTILFVLLAGVLCLLGVGCLGHGGTASVPPEPAAPEGFPPARELTEVHLYCGHMLRTMSYNFSIERQKDGTAALDASYFDEDETEHALEGAALPAAAFDTLVQLVQDTDLITLAQTEVPPPPAEVLDDTILTLTLVWEGSRLEADCSALMRAEIPGLPEAVTALEEFFRTQTAGTQTAGTAAD